MTYAGDAAEARRRLVGLRQRARASRNPSALAWAFYVTGEAIAETDVPSARRAYHAAAEESLKVDNRLFLGLARSSAAALASRRGSPQDVLAQFERVMGEWDELGNVAAQWWMLLQVALLLTRIGLDRPAALLIGAFRENGKQTYLLLGDEDRFQSAVATLTDRLGAEAASALAEGAELAFDDAAALARATIATLRS
jgi:hypothetical protein